MLLTTKLSILALPLELASADFTTFKTILEAFVLSKAKIEKREVLLVDFRFDKLTVRYK